MASEMYDTGISPMTILKVEEEEKGLVPNHPTFGSGVRKRRRSRFTGKGKDLLTLAEMKVSMTAHWKEAVTYVEIAEKVNDEFGLEGDSRITASNVQYHITQQLSTARKMALANITERQALILARYEQLEWIATEAYFASMESKTTNYEKMTKQARSREREKQLLDDLNRERKRVHRRNEIHRQKHEPLERVNEPDHVIGDFPFILEKTHQNIKKFKKIEERPAGDPRWVAMLVDINDKKAGLFGLKNKRDDINPDQELAKLSDEERTSRLNAVIHAALKRKTGDHRGNLAAPSPLGGFKKEDPEPEIEDENIDELEIEDVPDTTEYDWD